MGRPVVDEGLWIEAQRKALDLRKKGKRVDASELAELGLAIVLALLAEARLPDDLGYILEKHNPDAAAKLRELLANEITEPVRG